MITTTDKLSFNTFWWRVTIVHMVSYLMAGMLMWFLLDVQANWDTYEMAKVQRPSDSPWVAAATVFQIITGLVWAVVLWPFREIILGNNGWLRLWLLLIGLAIIGIEPPAPGAIEGFIYLNIPFQEHLRHMPEHFLQTLLCSLLLIAWYRKPMKLWNIISIIFLVCTALMAAAIFLSSMQNS